MLFRLIVAWLCNLIDTIATAYLYTNFDGEELNPISAWLLSQSVTTFVAFKLIVVTYAVVFMWWKRDLIISVTLARRKIDIPFCKITSWMLFVEYLLVAIYYLVVFYLLFI